MSEDKLCRNRRRGELTLAEILAARRLPEALEAANDFDLKLRVEIREVDDENGAKRLSVSVCAATSELVPH